MTLTYSMDAEMKNLIDIGVMSAEARENLKYCGVSITWDFLKTKYKNIEEGIGDHSKSRKQSLQEQLNSDLSIESQSMRNALRDVYKKEYEDQLPALVEWAKAKLNEDDAKITEHVEGKKKKITDLSEEKSKLEQELPTLGFFKSSRKKEIASRLSAIEEELQNLAKQNDENYIQAVLRWRCKYTLSAEELGQDVATLLYLIALNGPSVIMELTKNPEIAGNKRSDLLYWATLAKKLCNDGILVFLRKRMGGYYALPDNYEEYLEEGEHEINLQRLGL